MVQQQNRKFKIIEQEATFSDKTTFLLLSKNYSCYTSLERSLTIEEETTICIDKLYRSTITDRFFWYSYSIADGKVIGEYIEINTEEQVKNT